MLDPVSAEIVAEMEEHYQRNKEQAVRRQRAMLTEEIGAGLGKVAVNGYGELRSITIERDAFRITNEDALAEKVVAAVRRAERKAQGRGER